MAGVEPEVEVVLEAGTAGAEVAPGDNMKPAVSVADKDRIEEARKIEAEIEVGIAVGIETAEGVGTERLVAARVIPHQT